MYRAPLKDIQFALEQVIDTTALSACPEFSDYSAEFAGSVPQEAARRSSRRLVRASSSLRPVSGVDRLPDRGEPGTRPWRQYADWAQARGAGSSR